MLQRNYRLVRPWIKICSVV